MKSRSYTLIFCLVALLLACRLGARSLEPTPLPPTAMVEPTQSAPEASPTSTVVVEQGQAAVNPPLTATPDSANTSPAPIVAADLPQPALFETAWDDRSPFQAGLVASEQGILNQLPGASVYHIDFSISNDLSLVKGHEEVLYTNQEADPLNEIFFHLYPNLLGGYIVVSDLRVNNLEVTPTYQANESFMQVPLAQALQPGEQVVISLEFTISVPSSLERNYGIFARAENILALAHFYPLLAVYDDHGWDVEVPSRQGDVVYADTSFYRVRVTAPAALKLVTSGVASDHETLNEQQIVTIAAGPMRDFYLAASERYELVVSGTLGEIQVHSYALAGQLDTAQRVLDVALDALESYNARYGSYPYTEFDLVPTSNLALGIEYPGLVVITLPLYNPDAKFGERPASAFLETTVAHEVGHQWFYSLVGNDQLDEPWLDEALAQYATWRYYLDVGGQAAADKFEQELRQRQDKNEAIPIGLPVSDYDETQYSAVVYGRGPLFFGALAERLGQETVDAFLRDYALTYRWQLATGDDLEALAEEHCDCDLSDLFAEWVYPK